MAQFTIGKLADASQVSVETIRYYERSGLLNPPQRSASGYRLYRNDDVRRLRFILRAKTLGFTLEEIQALMQLSETDADRCDVKSLAAEKLSIIDAKITDLQSMRDALGDLHERCDGRGSVAGCPIIEALNQTESP